MRHITVSELKQWMESKKDFQLIDVREEFEYEEINMGGHLIPLAELPDRMNEIDRNKDVVVHCRSGKRSQNAIQFLESHGYTNLYNLEGGILAWLNEGGK
ncbi:MAG: rhodanese-like domain-containing protein [Bacteroidia bacterium]|nr:rhodanese-like domain-containing protein [Bacteroidia bacterium]